MCLEVLDRCPESRAAECGLRLWFCLSRLRLVKLGLVKSQKICFFDARRWRRCPKGPLICVYQRGEEAGSNGRCAGPLAENRLPVYTFLILFDWDDYHPTVVFQTLF